MTYLVVDDILDAQTRAENAGGEIIRSAFRLPEWESSRFVTDPAGAIIGLIEPEGVHLAARFTDLRQLALTGDLPPDALLPGRNACLAGPSLPEEDHMTDADLLDLAQRRRSSSSPLCAAIPASVSRRSRSRPWFAHLSPAAVIPSIFLLEIAASIHMLPSMADDWRSIAWLILGSIAGTPLGVAALSHFPPAPMTLALAVFVLTATLLLWSPQDHAERPGNAGHRNGRGRRAQWRLWHRRAAGHPVLFRVPAGDAARARIAGLDFLATDLIGLGFMSRDGLVTWESAVKAAVFLPALAAGVWLGSRSFRRSRSGKIPSHRLDRAGSSGGYHRRKGGRNTVIFISDDTQHISQNFNTL